MHWDALQVCSEIFTITFTIGTVGHNRLKCCHKVVKKYVPSYKRYQNIESTYILIDSVSFLLFICFQTGGLCFSSPFDIETDVSTLYEVTFGVSTQRTAIKQHLPLIH